MALSLSAGIVGYMAAFWGWADRNAAMGTGARVQFHLSGTESPETNQAQLDGLLARVHRLEAAALKDKNGGLLDLSNLFQIEGSSSSIVKVKDGVKLVLGDGCLIIHNNKHPVVAKISRRYFHSWPEMLQFDGLTVQNKASINEYTTQCFHTDTSPENSSLTFDLGESNQRCFLGVRIVAQKKDGGPHATWAIEYSDTGNEWKRVKQPDGNHTEINLKNEAKGATSDPFEIVVDWANQGAHRYWRIRKLDKAKGAGYHNSVQWFELVID
jgi:hypothetical protein